MNRLRQILKDRRGVAFPLIIAIVLVLVMLMCCISEYFRLLIVAQGVRDAVQEAVISTVNDNYDDVYHSVREGQMLYLRRFQVLQQQAPVFCRMSNVCHRAFFSGGVSVTGLAVWA